MAALDAVRATYCAGVQINTDGEHLLLSGKGELTPELRAALVAHKPAIITILTVYSVGQDDGYGEYEGVRAGPKRFATPPGCLGEGACSRLGWCERALAGRCCDQTKQAVQSNDEHDGKEMA